VSDKLDADDETKKTHSKQSLLLQFLTSFLPFNADLQSAIVGNLLSIVYLPRYSHTVNT
jgi:hypothetical protein